MNLYDRIPNNVNLSEDKKLQRALEKWLPNYLDWWREMGPDGFQEKDVWLRTAIDVGSEGWAHFDYVKMPEYRWGIFLEPAQPDAKVGFGDNYGRPAYQEVPGEFRNALRRIIVTQGDTEPASVEQQRQLGKTCPSLYDLRNLFQVNVEEGRHLWAMVYLLHGTSVAMVATKPTTCCNVVAAILTSRAFWKRSINRVMIGSTSSPSRCSRIAMANISSPRLRNRVSSRSHARANSCSPKKRITCLSATLDSDVFVVARRN